MEDTPLHPVALEYLQRRGYDRALLRKEGVFTLDPGTHYLDLIDTPLKLNQGVIVFTCRSPGGQIAGIQTVAWEQKEYRYFPSSNKAYLPIMYGSEQDYDLVYRDRRVILTEGIFDRIAVKNCLPEWPVLARLSKGTSGLLSTYLRRYAELVVLAFDQDGAGKIGTEKAEKRIAGEVEIQKLDFPAKDPAELLEKKGLREASKILRARLEATIL